MNTYIHTFICINQHKFSYVYIMCRYLHICTHTYIHPYLHTCTHTYIHTYIAPAKATHFLQCWPFGWHPWANTHIHIWIYIHKYIYSMKTHIHSCTFTYIWKWVAFARAMYMCTCKSDSFSTMLAFLLTSISENVIVYLTSLKKLSPCTANRISPSLTGEYLWGYWGEGWKKKGGEERGRGREYRLRPLSKRAIWLHPPPFPYELTHTLPWHIKTHTHKRTLASAHTNWIGSCDQTLPLTPSYLLCAQKHTHRHRRVWKRRENTKCYHVTYVGIFSEWSVLVMKNAGMFSYERSRDVLRMFTEFCSALFRIYRKTLSYMSCHLLWKKQGCSQNVYGICSTLFRIYR